MVENSLDFDTWKTQLNLAEGEADENDVQRLWKTVSELLQIIAFTSTKRKKCLVVHLIT